MFRDLLTAVEGVSSEQDRATLRDAVGRMEKAPDRGSFTTAYKEFIALAADHMTVIAPFLPALSMML